MQIEHKRKILASAKRIVVKLGSSVVTTRSGVHVERVGRIAASVAKLRRDHEVIVVTSGARAAGLARLGLDKMPTTIPAQQAAAAIGQIGLMGIYERAFADFDCHVGQVLLTAADIGDRTRYLNAKRTLDHLLKHQNGPNDRQRLIPIVNENDSVAIDELKFGDNDRLSALVAGLAEADLLIMLSDVEGLHLSDPRKEASPVLELVLDADAALENHRRTGTNDGAGELGTGGMTSKLVAAASACHRGIPTVIASGLEAGVLDAVMDPEQSVGTLFLPAESPISNRKHWIAYGMPVLGSLTLDSGAFQAVTTRGGSLLPAGVLDVQGQFVAGDCVACKDESGREFARGLVGYDAADCRRIRGLASSRILETLGYHISDEMIHRNDMVLTEKDQKEVTP